MPIDFHMLIDVNGHIATERALGQPKRVWTRCVPGTASVASLRLVAMRQPTPGMLPQVAPESNAPEVSGHRM